MQILVYFQKKEFREYLEFLQNRKATRETDGETNDSKEVIEKLRRAILPDGRGNFDVIDSEIIEELLELE